jgi:carbon monoxide dehydrogenase subunit G
MAVKIVVDLNRKFNVNADIDTVFALVSDVPASASHFPKVESITALEDNTFRWIMEEVSSGGYSIQSIYASKYVADSNAKSVAWTPIKGEGNGLVSGKYELKELATGTQVSFKIKAELTLPFPGLLKLVISPLVKLEFTEMVDKYLNNLKTLWS